MTGLYLVACQAAQPEEQAFFRIDGDTSWQSYSRLLVVLAAPQGNVIDTLFNAQLKALSELTHLDAPHYHGGKVLIGVYGYASLDLVFTEGREFDGSTQRVLAILDSIPAVKNGVIVVAVNPDKPATPNPTDSNALPPVSNLPPVVAPPPSQSALPRVLTFSGDTVVSIHDAVSLVAKVQSGDSRVLSAAWDYENDGKMDDSVMTAPTGLIYTAKPKYANPGKYTCRFVVRTALGKAEVLTHIEVLLDPPEADAGPDTTVVAGTLIYLHARAMDRFGSIAKREWQIGEQAFKTVTQQETTLTAPLIIDDLICVLRVTDNDKQIGMDTLIVHVVEASIK